MATPKGTKIRVLPIPFSYNHNIIIFWQKRIAQIYDSITRNDGDVDIVPFIDVVSNTFGYRIIAVFSAHYYVFLIALFGSS